MTSRLITLLALILSLAAPARPAIAQQSQQPTLKVATRIIAPFVTREINGALAGFSVDLWRAVARDLDVKYEFVVRNSVVELLEEVGEKRADLAISAISITAERERNFDFSQPMFDAGLQIMAASERVTNSGFSSFLTLLKSPALLEMLAILLGLILLPTPLLWWIERKHDNGVATGNSKIGEFFHTIWWSAATLGAQSPIMPARPLGKLVAILWMFVSVVFISFFTATVTTALTVKQLEQGISGPQDLIGKTVATTAGSTGAAYLRQLNVNALEVQQIEQAYSALQDGRVQAILGDAPVLLYYASHDGKGKVQMAGNIFRPENYGIVFPSGSPLRKQVNEALLKLKESGEYRSLYRKWFAIEAPEKD